MLPLPGASTVIASTTPVAATVFTAFDSVIGFTLGIIVAVLVIGFVIRKFGKAGKAVLKRRR